MMKINWAREAKKLCGNSCGVKVECNALEVDVDGLCDPPTDCDCTTGYVTVRYFSVGVE
jgi:hypothetical protein